MRKRFIPILCAILMCFTFLGGCVSNNNTKDESDKQTSVDKDSSSKQEDTSKENTSLDEQVEENIPYIIRLKAPVDIFKGASYDDSYVQTIYEDGSYTIVEEKNVEGRKWGKLKSGVGWIDLTNVQDELASPSLIRMGVVDGKINGNYSEFKVDHSEHSKKLIFIPREEITDFHFLSMERDESGVGVGESYCTIDKITPDNPLVIHALFNGDFTTYGIVFEDSKGNRQNYLIYESGKNGAIILEKYIEK